MSGRDVVILLACWLVAGGLALALAYALVRLFEWVDRP